MRMSLTRRWTLGRCRRWCGKVNSRPLVRRMREESHRWGLVVFLNMALPVGSVRRAFRRERMFAGIATRRAVVRTTQTIRCGETKVTREPLLLLRLLLLRLLLLPLIMPLLVLPVLMPLLMMALMLLGMAASYDSDPHAKNGFRLPFDLQSGQLIPERWRAWLRHDPINQIKRYGRNLKKLRGLFIDCGRQDQFHIHYGSRQLSQALVD